MKKLFFFLTTFACINVTQSQVVGIGTPTPNNNAVLDIVSNTKGVLIPRIPDTSNVVNPLEGLIIYNKNTKAPYYYDGKQWLSLGGRLPGTLSSSTDKITYQVTGEGFSMTDEVVYSFSHGVSNPTIITGGISAGQASLSAINFMKETDINTMAFNMAPMIGKKFESMEIKVFATGALVPYISYKLRNIMIESFQVSGSAGGGPLTESVSVAFEIYGFKDWVNSKEFGYNLLSKTITGY
ncbi:MAG: type VI secretion system tube protein Hcp [Bacteroidota bacterium]